MSRDGSGNYGLPAGNPVVTNTVISSTWANLTLSDIASALTQSLSKDGQTTPTANLTMGNFRLISLAAGTNRTDAVNVGQVQDNTPAVLSSIAGTGDAITAATAPAIVSYATGSKFIYTPTASNTLTNPTIAIDGLAAKTITQSNGVGLWKGAFAVGTPYELLYDGTNFRVQSGQLGNTTPQTFTANTFRNAFIDGNFDLWNQGTSYNVSGVSPSYTADMWMAAGGNSGTATVSKQVLVVGQNPSGNYPPPINVLSFQQTVASTGVAANGGAVLQKIEHVTQFSGNSVTFSGWLWCSSGTITGTSLSVNQSFGSGGSGVVNTIISTGWTITTTPTYFSIRMDIPNIIGKTVGAGDYISFALIFPTGVTFTCFLSQLQVESCPSSAPAAGLPTPFEFRGLAVEQMMANRFLQVFSFIGTTIFAVGSCPSTTTARAALLVPIQMRAIPAVSSSQTPQLTGSFSATTATLSMPSINSMLMAATVVGATAWQACNAILASSGSISLDARL